MCRPSGPQVQRQNKNDPDFQAYINCAQYAQNKFTSNSFYSILIILQNNSIIINFNENVLARLFLNVVPQVYLNRLENTIKQHLNECNKNIPRLM